MIFLYYKGTIQLPKNMVRYIKYWYDISLLQRDYPITKEHGKVY